MDKLTMTKEYHNALVDTFEERAKNMGYKGKSYLKFQAEFFLGAIRMLDLMNGDKTKTLITPMIAFSIMRGDKIVKL